MSESGSALNLVGSSKGKLLGGWYGAIGRLELVPALLLLLHLGNEWSGLELSKLRELTLMDKAKLICGDYGGIPAFTWLTTVWSRAAHIKILLKDCYFVRGSGAKLGSRTAQAFTRIT